MRPHKAVRPTSGRAGAVVAGESLIFAANRFRCPLTKLAARFGAANGSVSDIFLPRWFAHNLPAIHVPLIVLAMGLHLRNLRLNLNRGGLDNAKRPSPFGVRDVPFEVG